MILWLHGSNVVVDNSFSLLISLDLCRLPLFLSPFFFHIETLICLWCVTLFHSTLGFSKPFVVYGMHCVAVRCYV